MNSCLIKIFDLTQKYRTETETGSWLNSFNPETINVQFISGTEGKRQAEYRPLENSVLLAEDSDIAVLFGSYVHELYHAYQRYRYGLILYWLFLGLFRPLMERYAKQAELDATEFACSYRLETWKKESGL